MIARIEPVALGGTIPAIPSKSEAHRALVCAALSDAPTCISCRTSSQDIDATLSCLAALGARIGIDEGIYTVLPIGCGVRVAGPLDCHESGSTLRFLLPVAAALGGACFQGAPRLSERPLLPLIRALREHGVAIDTDGELPLTVSGRLSAGTFALPGNISSQYVTGLLLAAPLLDGTTVIRVAEPVESKPYIALTLEVLHTFGINAEIIHEDGCTSYTLRAQAAYRSPGSFEVGGDWSNAAFWLAAGALSGTGVCVEGLSLSSKQADRAILGALSLFGARVMRTAHSASTAHDGLRGARIDVSSCPDLVPAIAPLAALAEGRTVIAGAARLRLKESDRLASISGTLNALGARASIIDDMLVFEGVDRLHGGEVDAAADHRIAMMAALAATRADGPVLIHGAECTAKSYPGFFEDFAALGGHMEWEV
ncbi:3-phosphoshikimate 1-carboxyvinyltransferase [Coriobacteriales bacterium OH1046]|nr:3-phosphoshikimate 1-carboxyvinyltransferase [Coriobacteriales bacterium OH1046]